MENPKHPKFVRWALMLGIIVVLNIFFTVVVALALPVPDMATYCPAATSGAPAPEDAADCSSAGGVWTETGAPQAAPAGGVMSSGYCDLYAICQPLYQTASDQHDLYAFVFMIALGVIALIAGFFPIGSSIVSGGLSYGGVLALIIGSAQYWNTAGNWLRLAIVTIALLALLYIGWKRFKD